MIEQPDNEKPFSIHGGHSGRFDSSKPNLSNAPQGERLVYVPVDKPLTFSEYQTRTVATAVYPECGSGSLAALSYVALGLASEAGEVAGKVKKLLRDGDSPGKRAVIRAECGDCLWYLAQTLLELGGFSMSNCAEDNLGKLAGRKERGTLHGSGDER